jgi:hypothetical protein
MARHRRHRRRRGTGVKTYLLIFVLCSAMAVALHFLYGVPDKVQEYADQRLEEAVRSAVRAEVQAAAKEQVQP